MDDEFNQNDSESANADLAAISKAEKFAHSLSNVGKACPPVNAKSCPEAAAIRWVANNPPLPQDFLPKALEGGFIAPTSCPCECRGISFYINDGKREKFNDLQSLPSFEGKNIVAIVQLNPSSGKVKSNDPNPKGHVCLWRYQDYEPHQHVIDVEVT